MTAVVINPGSGPCDMRGVSSLKNATANMRTFRRELGDWWRDVEIRRLKSGDEDGRYLFALYHLRAGKKRPDRCEVMMPGLPLAQVRWRENTKDNIWDFPRLLIGPYGSSWIWPFALNDVRAELRMDES